MRPFLLRHALALTALLLATAGPCAAQPAADANQGDAMHEAPAGDGSPPTDPDEVRSLEGLLGFTAGHAAMAGAASVCNMQVFEAIRDCTGSVVRDWAALSHLGSTGDPAYSSKAAAEMWQRSFAASRDRQTSLTPPMSCAKVMDTIGRDPVIASCARSGVRPPPPAMGPLRIQ